MKTLLLTGTINPSFFNMVNSEKSMNVYLQDSTERKNEYIKAIEQYLKHTKFDNIVFIENSDKDFPVEEYQKLAIERNKKFEFIKRNLNETEKLTVLKKGKSYGEADMIKYAMHNSELIKESKSIYKVTGRVFLMNADKILKKHNDASKFITKNKIGWSNTEFFQINKEDYYNHFENDLTLINDYEGKNIERVWFSIMKNSDIKLKKFCAYPKLRGRIAGTQNGRYDKSKIELAIGNVLLKIGYFNLKKEK